MKILPINNNSFQGLYKLDRQYIGDNTESFILNNKDVIHSHEHWSDDVFVYTPSDKDEEFEQCIKKDNGKFWKSKPLPNLMMYPGFLREIFRINYVSNDHKADWTDYTQNWQPPAKYEDDEPF